MVAMKINAGFKGVTNSSISPTDDFAIHEAREAILDPAYVVALLQRAFYNENAYDVNSKRWENVSPAKYREAMNKVLARLEDVVGAALDAASAELEGECPTPKE